MTRKTTTVIAGAMLLVVVLLGLMPERISPQASPRSADRDGKETHSVSYRSEFLILEWMQKTLSLIRE